MNSSRSEPSISASRSRAFVPGASCRVAATGSGKLNGLRFAVKDLIDVAGYITGGGNPHWLAEQVQSTRHASAVARLLAAGARVRGKTVTDELAFSLEGENWHYGTPVNPRCPDCLPGGSSSGSAAAVAARLVDFALGTDTGGSVRIPASFCGLFGMRPSQGAVAMDGVIPFAPSYDTIGWFTRSAEMLASVGEVLLDNGEVATSHSAPTLLIASDAFALCDPAVATYLQGAATALGATQQIEVFNGDWQAWLSSYQILQGADIRMTLGPWLERVQPQFGPAIAPRFAQLSDISDQQIREAGARRTKYRQQLQQQLTNNQILLLPTSPTTALAKASSAEQRGDFYVRSLSISAIAGHAGLPQVSVPLGLLHGKPTGLSFIGAQGADGQLLQALPAWVRVLEDSGFGANLPAAETLA